MPIEVKEEKPPSRLSKEFEHCIDAALKAGLRQLGWLKVTVFSPLTTIGFGHPDRTAVLVITGAASAQGLAVRAVDVVSTLDSGAHITTTSAETALSDPKHQIFKFSHPNADVEKLLRFHTEHRQEHRGKALAAPSTVQELKNYLRDYLQYEMESSIYRFWLIPARTVPTEFRPVESPEGCYVSVDSLSIRVVMDAGQYMWGAFGIHDSGSYKVVNRDEYTCDIRLKSKAGGSKLVRLTREGVKYVFTPLPGRDSPDIFRRIDGGEFLSDSKGRNAATLTLAEGAPTGKFLPVKKAVEQFEDGFVQNVRKEVLPYLIESGALQGKKIKKEWQILDTPAFRKTMQFGIERFVLNRQGWSFVAIKASIESVAKVLLAKQEVTHYEENVGAKKLRNDATIAMAQGKRHLFLVKFRVSEWTVIIQTVHWIAAEDPHLATEFANDLSRKLKNTAIAAWDDDFSGSVAIVFNAGKRDAEISTEEDYVKYFARFYSEGIYIPEAFIADDCEYAHLLLTNLSALERADYAEISLRL
jgi:hypothetical protein